MNVAKNQMNRADLRLSDTHKVSSRYRSKSDARSKSSRGEIVGVKASGTGLAKVGSTVAQSGIVVHLARALHHKPRVYLGIVVGNVPDSRAVSTYVNPGITVAVRDIVQQKRAHIAINNASVAAVVTAEQAVGARPHSTIVV